MGRGNPAHLPMKIRILRTTVADKQFVRAGEICDLSDYEAKTLIQLGKAEAVDAVEEPAAEVLDTTEAEAVVDTGTPKRKGRSRVQ